MLKAGRISCTIWDNDLKAFVVSFAREDNDLMAATIISVEGIEFKPENNSKINEILGLGYNFDAVYTTAENYFRSLGVHVRG